MSDAPATVAEYLAGLPDDVRTATEAAWDAVRRGAPGCEEAITYGMPTLRHDGRNLVHVAGWKGHVSVYPVPAGDAALEKSLRPYVAGRGTLKFPLHDGVPVELLEQVAAALLDERS